MSDHAANAAHDAQQRLPDGTVVEFVVSTQFAGDIRQKVFNGGVLIFTGPSQGIAPVGDCDADGSAPIQSAIVISASGEPTLRIDELMPTSHDEAVPPGTRLGHLQDLGLCAGTALTIFQGTVD